MTNLEIVMQAIGDQPGALNALQRLTARAGRPSELLVGFLYTLMRDDVLAGRVEKLVMNGETHPPPYKFSNPHLEAYARELAARLRDESES